MLISILLPSLNKAKEAARRAACLSNQRQIGQLLTMYANSYKNYVPIGCWALAGGSDGFWSANYNYWFYYNAGNSGLGALYDARLIGAGGSIGRIFYCPSVTDPNFSFNTPTNPFPSDGNTNVITRTGYPVRPVNTIWTYMGGGKYKCPAAANPGPPGSPNSGAPLIPRTTNLKNKAILSDPTNPLGGAAVSAKIYYNHTKGVNVLYGDGSAHWVQLDAYKANLDLYAATGLRQYLIGVVNGAPSTANVRDLNSNPVNYGIWGDLDRN